MAPELPWKPKPTTQGHKTPTMTMMDDTGDDSVRDDTVTEEAIQRAAALLILKIREGHRIPLSVMDAIVADVSAPLALSAIRQRDVSRSGDQSFNLIG